MIVQNYMECDECEHKGPVIIYIFDTRRKEIRLHPDVYSNNISVELYTIKIVKQPNKEKNRNDYLISCPLCGKFSIKYENVPFDWNVFCGRDAGLNLFSFSVDEFKNIGEAD